MSNKTEIAGLFELTCNGCTHFIVLDAIECVEITSDGVEAGCVSGGVPYQFASADAARFLDAFKRHHAMKNRQLIYMPLEQP